MSGLHDRNNHQFINYNFETSKDLKKESMLIRGIKVKGHYLFFHNLWQRIYERKKLL